MQISLKIYRVLVNSLIVILFFYSCTSYSEDVENVLDLAGENKSELEAVLTHYQETGENLKLKAALFLIANMDFKYSFKHSFLGQNDKPVFIDYSKYNNTHEASLGIDSVRRLPEFKKEERVIQPDYKMITSEYLINNIDNAFNVWQNVKWCESLTFEEFCEFILPYRVLNEPIANWRGKLFSKYQFVIDSLNTQDVSHACEYLNGGLNDSIVFWPAYSLSDNTQIVDSIFKTKKGKCPDLTVLSTSVLRSVGIPVLVDECMYWGNSGFGHLWNRLKVEDGTTVRFNSIDKSKPPYQYPNEAKMPKVFRLTYKKQSGCLFNQLSDKRKIPAEFLKNNLLDVTREYEDTGDIDVCLRVPVPEDCEYAYLCVFNYGQWRPVFWGKIEDGKAVFTNMGKDILYLPMYYFKKRFIPAAQPFIYNCDGTLHKLSPIYSDEKISLANYMTKTEKGRSLLYITKDMKLTIKYWDDEWKVLEDYRIEGDMLKSNVLPKNCLYLIEPENPDYYFIRPFIVRESGQKYY